MKKHDDDIYANLPATAAEYIRLVVKKVGYKRKIRNEIRDELIAHFEDALANITDPAEKEQKAKALITEFGDPKLLATFSRRAKKRSRPMWVKILIRTSQATAVIFAYLIACSAPFFIGKPRPSVNYLDVISKELQNNRDPNCNDKPAYDSAAALSTAYPKEIEKVPFWPDDVNETNRILIAKWLNDNKQAIDAFRHADKYDAFWFAYNYESLNIDRTKPLHLQMDKFIQNVNSTLMHYRYLAYAVSQNAMILASQGNIRQALEDCANLSKFGSMQGGQGLVVEQLVGIGINTIGHKASFEILARANVPNDDLKKFQNSLSALPYISINYASEKILYLDLIQHYFSDNGSGDGHVLARGLPYVCTDSRNSIIKSLLTFDFPTKKEALTIVSSSYDQLQINSQRTPYDLRESEYPKSPQIPMMLAMNNDALNKVAQITWRDRVYHEGLIATVATLRYKAQTGACPDKLDDLVKAGYLPQIPPDPFGTGPLVYSKTADGFTLYSVGLNFKDDGGKIEKDKKGKPQMWSDKADAVFWPVVN